MQLDLRALTAMAETDGHPQLGGYLGPVVFRDAQPQLFGQRGQGQTLVCDQQQKLLTTPADQGALPGQQGLAELNQPD
ncbi:hypothetical protein D3C80_1054050 [compost metagenome]